MSIYFAALHSTFLAKRSRYSCGARCQAGFGRCNGGTAAPPVAPAPPPAPPAVPAPPPSPPQSRPYNKGAGVVAYFPNWSQKNLASFDLKGIDVINYAFVTMRSDGSLSGSGDYNQGGMQHTLNKVMKDRYPKLRTVFSIGGWTESQWFSVVAADAGRRARFATSIRDYMVANRFDGVDLDWEYPTGGGQPGNTESPQDSANFVLMVQEIRRAIGSQALITIAASADTSKYGNYLVPLANELDWINLMTYDFAGPWQGSAGLNSPLDAQSAAMQAFANAGVPKAKLSMGLAFYGRGFSVASGDNNGLGQRIVGTPGGDGAVE